jgi:hypothetical protein
MKTFYLIFLFLFSFLSIFLILNINPLPNSFSYHCTQAGGTWSDDYNACITGGTHYDEFDEQMCLSINGERKEVNNYCDSYICIFVMVNICVPKEDQTSRYFDLDEYKRYQDLYGNDIPADSKIVDSKDKNIGTYFRYSENTPVVSRTILESMDSLILKFKNIINKFRGIK